MSAARAVNHSQDCSPCLARKIGDVFDRLGLHGKVTRT